MTEGGRIAYDNAMKLAEGSVDRALELACEEVARLHDLTSLGYGRGKQPGHSPLRLVKHRGPPVLIAGEEQSPS